MPEFGLWNTVEVGNLMWSRMFIWCFNYTDDSLIFIIAVQSEKELWTEMSVQHLAATSKYDLRLLVF